MEELEERQLRVRPANGTYRKKGRIAADKKDSLLLKESWKQALILLIPMLKGDIFVLGSCP